MTASERSPADRLLEVLATVRERLAAPDACYDWSSWKGPADAIAEIDGLIARIRAGEIPTRELQVLFMGTGPIQEVSLSSGWANEFMRLAAACDAAISDPGQDRPATSLKRVMRWLTGR